MKIRVHLLAYDHKERIRHVTVPDIVAAKCRTEEDVLNAVFYYGQNDFQPLPMPSVSAGDVVFLGEKIYRIDDVGFSEMSKGEYINYCQLPRIDRSFYEREKRYEN